MAAIKASDKRIDSKLLNPKKIKMNKTTAIGYLTLSAFIGAFSAYFFVLAANLYSPGLAGISSGIAYTINDIFQANGASWWGAHLSRTSADSIIYWVVYGLFNIPIIYLSTKWFSNRFLGYSVYQFGVNFLFSMAFANMDGLSGGLIDMAHTSEEVKTLAILFFSFVGGIASGTSVGIAFKVGASTMGLDPVAKHISREKNINIGPIISVVAATTTTVFIILRSFIATIEVTPEMIEQMDPTMTLPVAGDLITKIRFEELNGGGFLTATLFSPEYIGSWLFIVSYSIVADAVYSSAKKVELQATTEKTKQISDYLNNSAYHRGHTIATFEGGYTHQERKAIIMVINYDEMYDVVEKIAAIDHKAFIVVKEVFKLYDVHNWTTITDEDREKERKRIIKQELHRSKLEKSAHKRRLRKYNDSKAHAIKEASKSNSSTDKKDSSTESKKE